MGGRLPAVLLGAAATLLVPHRPLTAQEPQFLRVSVVKVKPERTLEYEQLQAELTAAYKKAGVPWRSVWRTGAFGDVSTWVGVTPIAKFADFDAPLLAKAMGERAYERYLTRARNCVASVQYLAVQFRPDLSISSGSAAPPKLGVVADIHVVPGKELVFEGMIKSEVLPAMRKAGIKDYWVHKTVFGGPPNLYTIVSVVENYAELDRGSPLERSMGKEGFQKMRERLAGVVAQVNVELSAVVPELSYSASR
jgi:hypothetical protein